MELVRHRRNIVFHFITKIVNIFALIPINSDLQQIGHHSCEAGIAYVIASVFQFEGAKNRHTPYLLIDKKCINPIGNTIFGK